MNTRHSIFTVLNGLRIENQQCGIDHGLGISQLGIGAGDVIKGRPSLLYSITYGKNESNLALVMTFGISIPVDSSKPMRVLTSLSVLGTVGIVDQKLKTFYNSMFRSVLGLLMSLNYLLKVNFMESFGMKL